MCPWVVLQFIIKKFVTRIVFAFFFFSLLFQISVLVFPCNTIREFYLWTRLFIFFLACGNEKKCKQNFNHKKVKRGTPFPAFGFFFFFLPIEYAKITSWLVSVVAKKKKPMHGCQFFFLEAHTRALNEEGPMIIHVYIPVYIY